MCFRQFRKFSTFYVRCFQNCRKSCSTIRGQNDWVLYHNSSNFSGASIYLFICLFVCASVPLWRTVEFYLRWKSVWQVTFVRQSPCTPHFLPPPLNTTYELVLHIVQYNSLSLKKCVYNKNSYSQLSKWNDHWDCVAITSNNLQRHDL